MQIDAGIITISDRAARGLYDDLAAGLEKGGPGPRLECSRRGPVPDDKRDIQRAIRDQINQGCHVILTTGGTGVAVRDVTPEAVREIALRDCRASVKSCGWNP